MVYWQQYRDDGEYDDITEQVKPKPPTGATHTKFRDFYRVGDKVEDYHKIKKDWLDCEEPFDIEGWLEELTPLSATIIRDKTPDAKGLYYYCDTLSNITSYFDGEDVGILFKEGGKLKFKGDLDKSAEALLKLVCQQFNEKD